MTRILSSEKLYPRDRLSQRSQSHLFPVLLDKRNVDSGNESAHNMARSSTSFPSDSDVLVEEQGVNFALQVIEKIT